MNCIPVTLVLHLNGVRCFKSSEFDLLIIHLLLITLLGQNYSSCDRKDMETNSPDYWNMRFSGNWKTNHGYEQTAFFGQIVLDLMPKWLKDEVVEKSFSICDIGCACGQATAILSENLGVRVEGTDFSPEAIRTASELYPHLWFFVSDLNHPEQLENEYNITLCSNVLEHIENTWETAANLTYFTTDYILIMIPYKEYPVSKEHVRRFDSTAIPLEIAGWPLISVTAIDGASIPNTFYACPQIMLIYSNPNDDRNGNLGDLVESLEELSRSQSIREEREEKALLNKKLTEYNTLLYDSKTRLKQKENELLGLANIAGHYQNTITLLSRENQEISKELKRLQQEIELKDDATKRSMDAIAKVYSSNSWKIGRVATSIPRFLKKMLKRQNFRDN